jgi:hypothetical protein
VAEKEVKRGGDEAGDSAEEVEDDDIEEELVEAVMDEEVGIVVVSVGNLKG